MGERLREFFGKNVQKLANLSRSEQILAFLSKSERFLIADFADYTDKDGFLPLHLAKTLNGRKKGPQAFIARGPLIVRVLSYCGSTHRHSPNSVNFHSQLFGTGTYSS